MKTKPFLLATSGATVDGRTIDENMLREMAEGYDPKTYGARLNLEHIRGLSGDRPFKAFGDVLELSTAEVDVTIHGKSEKRTGLYGVLDINDDAKELNKAGQKVYPSIEIEPNFAGTGKAYLMGVALTDSPASIATEKLAFNRALPGTIKLGADKPEQSFAIEFAKEGEPDEGTTSFISGFGKMLETTFAKLGVVAPAEPKSPATPDPKPEAKPGEFNVADLKPLFEGLGQQFATQIAGLQTQITQAAEQAELRFKAIETTIETTPVNAYTTRPAAAGTNANATKTDC
jgi:hypothetical protein